MSIESAQKTQKTHPYVYTTINVWNVGICLNKYLKIQNVTLQWRFNFACVPFLLPSYIFYKLNEISSVIFVNYWSNYTYNINKIAMINSNFKVSFFMRMIQTERKIINGSQIDQNKSRERILFWSKRILMLNNIYAVVNLQIYCKYISSFINCMLIWFTELKT